jgi:hypothetical protein
MQSEEVGLLTYPTAMYDKTEGQISTIKELEQDQCDLNSTSKHFIFSQTEFRRRSEISPTILSNDAGIDFLNFRVDSIAVPGETSGKDRVPL